MPVRDALFKPFPDAPLHIFGNAARFLLCEGREQGEQQLPFVRNGMDVFPFKININPKLLQVPRCCQSIHGIPRKTADGLYQHHVNLPGIAVRKQPVEVVAVACVPSADALIRIYARKLPIRIFLYQSVVMADLRGKGMEEHFRLHRHPGISRHPLPLFQFRQNLPDYADSRHIIPPCQCHMMP